MPTCPLCEHVQDAGNACDVCGKELVAAARIAAPTGSLDGLEQTIWEEPFPEDAAPMQELELTALPDVGVVAEERVADLEATATAPVQVAASSLEDMDSGRSEDSDPRTLASPDGPFQCRYCRGIQPTGTFCDRCGMRLPRVSAPAMGPAGAAVRSGPAEVRLCKRCSERVVPGQRCQACGQIAAETDS